MVQEALFSYEPLATPTTFRLLELLPGHPDEIIQCHLRYSDLKDAPEYSALSYEWDLVPGDETIDVNGYALRVRKNLVAFLRIIRSKLCQPVVLWADAICIDQSNIGERGHQVQLMRDIFSQAREVKSWLGPSTPGIASVLQICKARPWEYYSRLGSSKEGLAMGWEKALTGMPQAEDWLRRCRTSEQGGSQAVANEILDNVLCLCRRRYWSRLWVIPEILLGKTVVVHCGDFCIDFDKLCTAMTHLSHSLVYGMVFDPDLGPARELALPRQIAYGLRHRNLVDWFGSVRRMRLHTTSCGLRPELSELLLNFGSMECLHNRDRVYALIGVATPVGQPLPIQADYTSTLGQVFATTLVYCIGTNQWSEHVYEALCFCLGLKPRDCLYTLLNEQAQRSWRETYHRSSFQTGL